MLKIKYIVTILFCALLGQLDAQIAKEWVIGYDYFQPSPLRIIYRTLNFKSSNTHLDTISCTTNARRGRNINRSSLADSVGHFYVLNLVQNLLQPKTDTFYTELGLLGIDYRQSLLIRNPRIDSVFYYLTLQHNNNNNNNGGFNKSFGVYLSTFSDSLGTIKTLVRNQFLDSLSGLIYKPFGSNGFFNNYSIYSFPHCNGRDLWIGFYHLVKKRFYTYLISDTGVTATPVISPSFSQIDFMIDLAVSPSSNAIVVKAIDAKSTTYFDRIHNAFVPDSSEVRLLTIQFDNTTGSFNSPTSFYSKKIHAYYNYVKNLFGNSIAFAPNGRFLYHLNVGLDYTTHNGGSAGVAYYPKTHHIEQYEAIGNSFGIKDTLAVIPVFNYSNNTRNIKPDDIALAPDGKIYIAFDPPFNGRHKIAKLGQINLPNKKGTACRLHLPLKSDTIGMRHIYFPRLPMSSVTETYFFNKNACAKDTTLLWVNDSTCLDSLYWDFGDPSSGALNTAKGFAVAHQYNTGGTYPLKLYRFGQGFTDTLHKEITIEGRDTVHTRSDTLLCKGDTISIGQNLTHEYNFLWHNRSIDSTINVHDSSWVWVEAFNNCIVTRDTMYVDYASTPIIDLGNDTSVCDTIMLTSNTWPLASYRWSNNDTTTFLGVNKTGTYQMISTNICGSDTDAIRVYIHNNAQTNIPDTTICRSTRCTVSVPAMPYTNYFWSNFIIGSSSNFYRAGTYWLRARNRCGTFLDTFVVKTISKPHVDLGNDTAICSHLPLQLNAGAKDTSLLWYWRHNASTDSTAWVNTSGTYHVEIKDQCGKSYDSIMVTHIDPPNLVINDTSICTSDSILITANADSASFRWSTGATTAAIWIKDYKVYGVGASNRCGTDSIVFKLSELLPPILFFPTDTILCNDAVWLLDAAQPRSTYLWKSGSNQSQKSISTEGLYAVTVTNACGSIDKAVSVTYQKTPLAAIAVSPAGKYCPGTPLTLNGSSLTENGAYTWSTGDSSNSIVVNRAGAFTLTLTNQCGSDSKTVQPNFYPLLAAFTLDYEESISPFMLTASNQSEGANAYEWLLDSTVISKQLNLSHRVVPFGQHLIYLIAKDEFGCSDTAIDTIQVLKNPNIPPLLCDFRVDPNPAQDYFVISASNNDTQVRQVKIFNELGQVIVSADVSHWKENPFYFEQRFNNLPSGNYLVGLFCEDETKYKKVVIAR